MKSAVLQSVPLELRRMLSLVGVSGLATLNLVAAALVIRRIVSANDSMSAGIVLSVGLSVILLCAALRELVNLSPLGLSTKVVGALASAAIGITCLGLSLPPTSVAATVVIWLLAIAVEGVYWAILLEKLRWNWAFESAAPAVREPATAKPLHSLADSGEQIDLDQEEVDEGLAADVISQLTRSRTEAGGEVIYGLLRAEFAVGQRQQWLNVAFCPPLASRPTCTAHFADDTTAMLEVEEVETYGTRLMVRLPEPAAEPCSLVVEMIAESGAGL